MKNHNLISNVNFRVIFLLLFFVILTMRFGRKMLEGYDAWDFFPTYYAAKNILTGADIYAYCGFGSYYTRTPIFALILSPLGLLPRNISSFVWCLLNTVALGTIFVICEKMFLRTKNTKNFFWIIIAPITLLLLSRPLVSGFLLGQVDILMLCFIMLALFFKERNKLIPAALFFTFAVSIKLTPLVFLPYFLLKKETKFVCRVLFFTAVFIFIPALFVSWGRNLALLRDWYQSLKMFNPIDRSAFPAPWYQSLEIFFRRFLFSDNFNFSLFKAPTIFAKYLFYLAFIAIYIPLILRPKHAGQEIKAPAQIIDYNILIIAMTIFSPLAADYTYVNLVVPITFLLYMFRAERLYQRPVFFISAALFSIFNFFTGTKVFRLIGIYSIQGESYIYLIFMTVVWQALALLFMLIYLKHKTN